MASRPRPWLRGSHPRAQTRPAETIQRQWSSSAYRFLRERQIGYEGLPAQRCAMTGVTLRTYERTTEFAKVDCVRLRLRAKSRKELPRILLPLSESRNCGNHLLSGR